MLQSPEEKGYNFAEINFSPGFKNLLHAGKAKRYSNIIFIELRNQFCLSMFYSCGSGNSKRYGGKRKARNWCDILKFTPFKRSFILKLAKIQ